MEATMNIKRNLLIVSLLVVLVLPTSFAFASGIEDVKGVKFTHCESNEFAQVNSLGYSGDDLYDSAADLLCEEASAEINTFSTSPELSVAQRYADVAPASAEINTFSANPELSVAQRYAVDSPVSAEINSFSTNPELSVAQFTTDVSPVSAEINTFPANPLSFWSPQIYADVAPVSAEINSFSTNPELMVAQRYAVAAPISAETKDCSADCYDNY